jgi:hypothetical protein
MKHTTRALLGLALLIGTTGCVSRNANVANHWSFESVETSVRQHIFGHSSSDSNALRDAYMADAENVLETISRHFMNDNPDNPLLPPREGLNLLPTAKDYELPEGGYRSSGQ